jgi:WbqC-like protein family
MMFAIHQPNYIPWIGYFYKIYRADVFVYLDAVQYPRGQSFGARNQIMTAGGKLMLTIPVSTKGNAEGKVTYNDVRFVDNTWRSKHLRTIEANYKKAPYFQEVFPLFHAPLASDLSFTDLNISIIEGVCDYLTITTPRKRLSELRENFGQKTDLIVDIADSVGADSYLCGDGGGLEYTNEETLTSKGISLEFTRFKHPVYKQLWTSEFVPYLSIIDLLFNEGKCSKDIMLEHNVLRKEVD